MARTTRLHPTNAAMLLGIRGLAAMWVFIGHIFISPVYDLGLVDVSTDSGLGWVHDILVFHYLAVDLFLLLSGALLYLGYRDYFENPTKSKDIDLFYAHRLARLYPLYVVGLAIIGAMHYFDIPHPVLHELKNPADAGRLFSQWEFTLGLNMLFMNAWGIVGGASWNEPSWTLSIIILCYITFPNIVVLLKHLPRHPAAKLALIYGVIILYYIVRKTVDIGSQSDGAGGVLRGMVFFISGCMITRIIQEKQLTTLPWHIMLPCVTIMNIALMIIWRNTGWKFDMVVFHLLYPLFILGLFYSRDRISSLLFGHNLIVKLGLISYGIYLLHYPICLLFEYWFSDMLRPLATGNAWYDSWIYAIVILTVCTMSTLSLYAIEKPVNRLVKNLLPLR